MKLTDDFRFFLKSVGMILVGVSFFFVFGFDRPFTVERGTEAWFLLWRLPLVAGPLAIGGLGVFLALVSWALSLVFRGLENFFKKTQRPAK